jgi:lysyl-tRNA synthetase class 1
MFWADRVAEEVKARFGKAPTKEGGLVVRDEKTVSGRVHVGSMRGVAIHGAVSEVLDEGGVQNIFRYEFNDFDPMDDIPTYLDQVKFAQYLGRSLRNIPSPDSSAKNFAEYFANEFRNVIEESGFAPEFYWASDLYLSGKMDEAIREALDHADDIRRIYKEVSGSQREGDWLPINVICPQCGKMTTTRADTWNGSEVHFICKVDAVEYTKGCGFEGSTSPFGGKAKLPWKVEWAAKWKVNSVDIEGGGKDHSTKGGSRDVANHISKEVFNYEPPLDVPYEFFLVGGKKMSSSKGRGSSAREIADLMPPKIFRLALLGKDINQAFNFDPEGDTIPILYDQYDKLAENYWAGTKDDFARLFEFIHPKRELPTKHFLPRFSQVAFIAQMPHLDFFEEITKLKGCELTDTDRAEADERRQYALKWLAEYAPEKYVFKLQDEVPEAAKSLSQGQKKALGALLAYIESQNVMQSGDELHQKLHGMKDELSITPQEIFSAVYLAFLGKSFGPKAGWFLSVLDRDFVLARLRALTT